MNISRSYPPNIEKIKAVLPIRSTAVFTYFDTIYAPGISFQLPDDLVAHERVHMTQQGSDAEGWWDKYLADPKFRLSQEIDAYRVQYRRFCQLRADRNERARLLAMLASDLASEMYGSIISFRDALVEIKH